MLPRSAAGVPWVLCALLAACGGEQPPVASIAQWTVDAEPVFSLADDGEDGEPLIGFAVAVMRLPNGQVIVADRSLFSLRWFSPAGVLVRTVGAEGRGPGEFEYIETAYRCGTFIYVRDITRGDLLQSFGFDGTAYPSVTPHKPSGATIAASVCNGKGNRLSHSFGDVRQFPLGRHRDAVPFWLSSRKDSLYVKLGDLPGNEWLSRASPEGGNGGFHPLGKQPVIAIGRDRAYVGTADSFTVQSYTLDGAPAALLRGPEVDLRTTDADVERFKYRDTVGMGATLTRAAMRDWQGVEYPASVPAYDAMLVDAEDLVWVRRYPRQLGGTADWVVFNSTGALQAMVSLPEALAVHEIGTDYIAGIEVDPVEGRQSVRVYTLRRGG